MISNVELDGLKEKLRTYGANDIQFNNPHFTNQLLLREGSKEEVIANLLNPEQLVYFYAEQGVYGDAVYCLYFKISGSKTLKLPVIFDRNGKKSLYILTYIMRHRCWQNMVRGARHG